MHTHPQFVCVQMHTCMCVKTYIGTPIFHSFCKYHRICTSKQNLYFWTEPAQEQTTCVLHYQNTRFDKTTAQGWGYDLSKHSPAFPKLDSLRHDCRLLLNCSKHASFAGVNLNHKPELNCDLEAQAKSQLIQVESTLGNTVPYIVLYYADWFVLNCIQKIR